MEKREVVRIPRPMGITQMMNEYHKLENPEQKELLLNKVRNNILYNWFLGNGKLCGKNYSINSMAILLNVEPAYIQTYMRDQVLQNRVWDKSVQQEIVEGLLGQQLVWAMEDRMEVQNQVEILKLSQGDKYTPFISAELNKALKLKLETSTSLQSIIRTLTGSGGTTNNFFTQINNQQNEPEQRGITQEEALRIIESTSSTLSIEEKRSEPAKFIEANYELENLPVVCALNQEGVNTEKEGLNLNKTELSNIIDDYKGAIEVSDKEFEEIAEELNHHESRRQLELGEDLDADDPECSIYDESID